MNLNNYLVFKKLTVSIEEYDFYQAQLFVYSLRIKVRDSFLSLLLSCYTMVVYAESTTGRSYIFCFIQHFSIFFHVSLSTVFKCSIVWYLCAKFKLVFQRVYQQCVLPHKPNISVHWNSSLKNPSSLLSCFFLVLAQHGWRNKLLQASAVDESFQSLLRDTSHYCLFSLRIQA